MNLSGIVEKLSGNNKSFVENVYSNGITRYIDRLTYQGLLNFQSCLDIGCGFGQWSFALSKLNRLVDSIDISEHRISICKQIQTQNRGYDNIFFKHKSIESIIQTKKKYDLIFCYSAIYMVDFISVFKQVFKSLNSEGVFYFNTNDIGWYFRELKSNNNLDDFDPEELALQTISNSIDYYSRGIRNSNYPIVMPIDYIIKILKDIGFKILGFGEDGTNSISGTNVKSFSFFPPKYEGFNSVYEVICQKI